MAGLGVLGPPQEETWAEYEANSWRPREEWPATSQAGTVVDVDDSRPVAAGFITRKTKQALTPTVTRTQKLALVGTVALVTAVVLESRLARIGVALGAGAAAFILLSGEKDKKK